MEYIKTKLIKNLNYHKHLIFYKCLDYPIPRNFETYFFNKKNEKKINNKQIFSRNKENKLLTRYIKKINKFGFLYKSIPFIKDIYLCNSITFNAIKSGSDIDIFIITKKDSLRRARFFSVLFFGLLFQKRQGKLKNKKFCLSFYTTENNLNLYDISINKTDIYLAYRISHLVPLYQEKENNKIITENRRIINILPNIPNNFTINIGNKLFTGKTFLKKIIEFLFGGLFGRIIENIIKSIRLPIVITKIKSQKQKNIIINKNMLKFYNDIRKKINTIYNINHKIYNK